MQQTLQLGGFQEVASVLQAAPGEWSMLHHDPGLFRSMLLRFQVPLRRSSMLAFEERAVLPRWDLLPGSDEAAYQRQTAHPTVQGSALAAFPGRSSCHLQADRLKWFILVFYKRLDFVKCINSTYKYRAQMRDT